ncbi:hypothetical protein J2S55_002739 [Streptosporangium brasiliense]|uniref:DUF2071 domain-containing protein n=1 Tax=Streptosporangium brasiliense TaxID=47480 RepID=A0ABT9R2L0_9ACTN|nr:hypothetical protein [Streptosporangium brasiliense]
MPESTRKSLARRRAQFTGECLDAARQGIGRGKTLGLDECTPTQQQFRALFALGFFNTSRTESTAAKWGIHYLSAYTITISPRWDRFVLIAEAPDNVTNYVARSQSSLSWFPGIRLEARYGYGSFVLRHLPTQTNLVITDNRSGKTLGKEGTCTRRSWIDLPLDDRDEDLLAGIPRWSRDAQKLLAGLAARISLRDPDGKWAIGQCFWDPLQRRKFDDRPRGDDRRLVGEGDSWTLEWDGYPYQDDLFAALTHPESGISGVGFEIHENVCKIFLGSASLTIRGPRP